MVKHKQTYTKQKTWLLWGMVSGLVLLIGGGTLLYQTQVVIYQGVLAPQTNYAGLDGQTLYRANCASCHGIQLEGQPNWKIPDENGLLPAPPHDNSGHTWHHADALLLEIIAEGGSMPNSGMPAYREVLTNDEMVAILVYIKTYWGERELKFQAHITQNEQ